MKILMLGDIVGRPGRKIVTKMAPQLREELGLDMIVANAENSAGGSGITPDTAKEILDSGVDVLTSGDHIFKQKSGPLALTDSRVLRPFNFPEDTPGNGWILVTLPGDIKIAVVNLLGRVFMQPADCPFRAIDKLLAEVKKDTDNIFVDFHAEATSEKIAMGWYLNGKVTAVCGTHTHVLTADNSILFDGTAYVSDLGMCGSYQSVLGREIEPVIAHFLTNRPHRFTVSTKDVRISGVTIDFDQKTGRALSIDLVQRSTK